MPHSAPAPLRCPCSLVRGERRYADGKKETVAWKAGMVQVVPPSGAYTTKNIGKTEIRLYVVQLK